MANDIKKPTRPTNADLANIVVTLAHKGLIEMNEFDIYLARLIVHVEAEARKVNG